MKSANFLSTILFACLLFNGISFSTTKRLSPMEAVADMGVGWNLGNTLDAWKKGVTGQRTETAWGVPLTKKEMFDEIKKKGFKTFRIPVTWRGHFGEAPDYTIDNSWLDRVETVANYALDGKTYVIINSHHDEWVTLTETTKAEVKNKITKIWTQIATRFKDYDDYLILETLNEPRLYGTALEWIGGDASSRAILNEYNEAIVAAIRATGGNNAHRLIMIPTYAAATYPKCQTELTIPKNDKRIIVSQHVYHPYFFTMDMAPLTSTDKWGSAKDKKSLIAEFNRIQTTFIDKGIPVVIGEWGTINKNNPESRAAHAKFYMAEAKKRGICAIWWDNNLPRPGEQTFGLFNRRTLKWSHPDIVKAVVQEYHDDSPVIKSGQKKINRGDANLSFFGVTGFSDRFFVSKGVYNPLGQICRLNNLGLPPAGRYIIMPPITQTK